MIEPSTIEAVQCTICGELFKKNSRGYVMVYGNIVIGNASINSPTEQIAGLNFTSDFKLKSGQVFCPSCLINRIRNRIEPDEDY